jgi:ribose transport system substrate-binding protein
MEQTVTLAVVLKGSQHQYWKSVTAGTAQAERDLQLQGMRVRLIRRSPLRDDEHEEQVKILENVLQQGVQGLILAPCNPDALVAPVEAAARVGVPTVVIDSPLESPNVVSFVGTDNRKAGMLAADHLGKILRGKGRVLVLRYLRGSSSTEEREEGFIQQLRRAYPGIELLQSDQYAGATRDGARSVTQQLLVRYGHDLQGMFAPTEPSTAGALMALLAAQLAGKVALVGFDASEIYVDSMRYKKLHGLVVQNPFRMGELGLTTLMDFLRGKTVARRIDTGVALATPENMDAPEIQELLHPPVLAL